MRRGPFHVLLLVALLLQCSPLCACAVAEWLGGHLPVSGGSQAAGVVAAPERVVHTCESPAGDERCSGFCSVSKATEAKKACRHAGDDLVPLTYLFVIAAPAERWHRVGAGDAVGLVHDGPSPPLRTPLLI